MKCRGVESKLWLFVEGDLKPKQQQAVARHVACCGRCAASAKQARESQEWLRSFEAPSFDEAFMASVRGGARRRIADYESARARFAPVLGRLSGKPLVIACPTLILAFWLAMYWTQQSRRITTTNPGVVSDVMPKQRGDQSPPAPVASRGKRNGKVFPHHNRPIMKTIEPALASAGDGKELLGSSREAIAPLLRIEIQTQDPNVRIIWFTDSSDQPVASESDDERE